MTSSDSDNSTGKAPERRDGSDPNPLTIANKLPNQDPLYRNNAPSYLQQLSSRPNAGVDNYYVSDRRAGKGSVVYVVDTGLDPSVDTFEAVQYISSPTLDIEDYFGQGSNVAALAVGLTKGVAPEAHLVSIKIFASDSVYTYTVSDYVLKVLWALMDITEKHLEDRAVISLALRKYIYS
jgi:oryzin